MKTQIALLVACLCWAAVAQQQTALPSETGHIANNVVFMSPGDKFGVNLAGAADGTALSITEEPTSHLIYMPQQNHAAAEVEHPEKVLSVSFVADNQPTKIL